MPNFIQIKDIDGDIHLCNLSQLCSCTLERREQERYFCTMQFCDNISTFYVTRKQANRLTSYLSEDI